MRRQLLNFCKVVTLIVVLLQATNANSNDITIEVYGDVNIGKTNLLVNPGFEEGSSGWTASTGRPDLFIFEIDEENPFAGNKAAYIAANNGVMSGYWAQTVKLIPGEKYLVSFWADIRRGYMLFYINGTGINLRKYVSARLDDSHFPVFVKAEHRANLAQEGWGRYEFLFTNANNATNATVNLGIYFTKGEAYFDNVYFGISDVSLGVLVKSKTGVAIKRIAIFDELDRNVFDKSYTDQKAERQELLNLPADTSYFKIIAYDDNGNQSQTIFPQDSGN